MALRMFVLKASEDHNTVTYRYGDGPEEIRGELTIDKISGEITIDKSSKLPVDENSMPREAVIALTAIVKGKSKAGDWPQSYTYAA